MTIFQMLAVLMIGIALLAFGIAKKKKWVMIVSAIPLLIVISQIILLVMMALH